ncbi:MAG: trypsin-like peptidase domain-containing protein [Anaerolineales bacterium]|nr:trypsin-like peptidase domain-containing protein [Anaerolineales bacterium]
MIDRSTEQEADDEAAPAPPPSSVSLTTGWTGCLLQAALFAAGVAAVLLGLVVYNRLNPPPAPLGVEAVNAAVEEALSAVTPPPANAAEVYQSILPALVMVQSESAAGPEGNQVGAGVIIAADGRILTALHLVEGASIVHLTFADGTAATGALTAATPEHDIAVLTPSQLPPVWRAAPVGNPDNVRIGDDAYVVGNPFGLYGSLSAGVISGLQRNYQPDPAITLVGGLIQVDAAVNPGSSGGPLLNRAGEVVGIVVGLVNPTEQEVFVGIGFAVPIDDAAESLDLPEF